MIVFSAWIKLRDLCSVSNIGGLLRVVDGLSECALVLVCQLVLRLHALMTDVDVLLM
jgi:hypothetical protein